MSYIETNPLKNSTIMFLFSERTVIQLDPSYQRMGGVWTLEKKQLLIDSILNDYDIPKIYFHAFERDKVKETGYEYAVIDGRQRLETIWGFIEGEYSLSSDFEYQRDPGINLAGLTYDDIAQDHPRIKIKFDSFVLPVVGIATDDEELIDDMFSRLNEAVPLNAAEKRNAIGGDMVAAIREISEHGLFKNKISFSNKRYQHREAAARFLLIEHSLDTSHKIVDTKKVYLDAMAKNYRSGKKTAVNQYKSKIRKILDEMSAVFSNSDPLLRAQGNLAVYYLLFREAVSRNQVSEITRRKLINFQDLLRKNRDDAASNYEESSFDLLEFDRLTQQGTNDASNIKERLSIIAEHLQIDISSQY